jgi:ubiquinone/menaquinone biosynthesis C-methylase UbiE
VSVQGPIRLSSEEIAGLDPYQLMAELGKRVIHPGGRRSSEEAFEFARIRAGERVLDVGCGVGTTAVEIAERFGCEVTAVDIDETMLVRAKQAVVEQNLGSRVSVAVGDIQALGFDAESFDVVLVEAVTMFVDRRRAISELVRVCRRGGRVVDHEFIWRKPPSPTARRIFTHEVCPGISFDNASDWEELYRQAGLVDLKTTTGPFAMMTPAGFLRDEGLGGVARFSARAVSRVAYIRKMGWLLPRMMRAMPYLGYVVVSGTRA